MQDVTKSVALCRQMLARVNISGLLTLIESIYKDLQHIETEDLTKAEKNILRKIAEWQDDVGRPMSFIS